MSPPLPLPTLALAVSLVACGGSSSTSGPAGKPGSAVAGSAVVERAPRRCELPVGPDAELGVGNATWKLTGHTLHAPSTATQIGVIADAGGAAPATLAALGRLRAHLGTVDLVIALGGMAETEPGLTAVIDALAPRGSPSPVIVVPGDLEHVDDLARAIAAARARTIPAFDGRAVERIELAGATLAVIGGAQVAERLVAGADGCTLGDPSGTFTALAAAPGLRVTASWEPLTPPPGAVDVSLVGAVATATAARSGKRDGLASALTPGSSDATARGERRLPTAGILGLADGAWTWRVISDTP